jgi:uroporphyrinogen-III synthase
VKTEQRSLPSAFAPGGAIHVTAAGLVDKRVVVTRSAHQAAEMADLLRQAGATPLLYPCLAIRPPEDLEALDGVLKHAAAGAYDRLVLTSANTVLVLAQRLAALNISLHDLPAAAIGPATAKMAETMLGIKVNSVAREHVAEALAEEVAPAPGERLLLPQSAIARPVLADLLHTAGAQVTIVAAYRTSLGQGGDPVPALLVNKVIDALTFTSSSTVSNFLIRLENEGGHRRDLAGVCLAAIGPVTAAAMAELSLPADIVPADYTLPGLITALDRYFTSE